MESLEKAIYLASSNDITLVAAAAPGEWTPERIATLGLAVSQTLKVTRMAQFTVNCVVEIRPGWPRYEEDPPPCSYPTD